MATEEQKLAAWFQTVAKAMPGLSDFAEAVRSARIKLTVSLVDDQGSSIANFNSREIRSNDDFWHCLAKSVATGTNRYANQVGELESTKWELRWPGSVGDEIPSFVFDPKRYRGASAARTLMRRLRGE